MPVTGGWQRFWRRRDGRVHAPWRIAVFLAVAAAVANPLVLLLDATDIRILESSLVNPLVAFGFILALWVVARGLEGRTLADYGLGLSGRWLTDAAAGAAIGIAVMSLMVMIQIVAGGLEVTGIGWTDLEVPLGVAVAGQLGRYLAGSLFEEAVTRGFLLCLVAEVVRGWGFGATRSVLGAWGFTSALFGVLHLFNPGATLLSAVNLTLIGGLLGLGMVLSGSLAIPIGLHAAWNITQNVLFGRPNSGKPAVATILVTEDWGPEVFTGGSFGPEASLLVLPAAIIGAALVAVWIRRRQGTVTIQGSLAD